MARRSSREACAAIRDSGVLLGPAAVAGHPLAPGPRAGASTTITASKSPAAAVLGQQRDVVHDDRVRGRLLPRARRSARRPAGARSPRGACARASSPNTSRPIAGRSSSPSGPSSSSPNSSTTAASPGVPFATTSRASASASMTTAPSSASIAATVLLPDATPPVSPTRMGESLFGGVGLAALLALRAAAPRGRPALLLGALADLAQELLVVLGLVAAARPGGRTRGTRHCPLVRERPGPAGRRDQPGDRPANGKNSTISSHQSLGRWRMAPRHC